MVVPHTHPSSPPPQGDGTDSPAEAQEKLRQRLSAIRHKVIVMSGKGGVGKSTVAVNLAVALLQQGQRVGLLDVDIHGPSVPTMLHLEGSSVESMGHEIGPVVVGGLKVMSMGFLLFDRTDAVIWRGPRKAGVIKSFLQDVHWGELDYLIVDAPPGTGDEPLSVCQLLEGAAGAVIVTTPQEVALTAVRKSITFCRKVDMPVLGIVENMSGFACPHCGEVTDIFRSGGGERMAGELGIPFLGRIPIDPRIERSGDEGSPFVEDFTDTPVREAFDRVVQPILDLNRSAETRRDG
jgi:ATP-binding protein involved in chromosome partitioning